MGSELATLIYHQLQIVSSDTNSSGVITASMVREELSKRSGRFAGDVVHLSSGETLEKAVRAFEIGLIVKSLSLNENNITKTAKALGVPRTTMRRKIDDFSISIK